MAKRPAERPAFSFYAVDTNKKGGPQGPPYLIQVWADQPPRSMTARRGGVSRSAIKNSRANLTNKKGGPQGPPFLIQVWADQPPRSMTARRFLGSRTPGPVGTSGSWKLLPSIAIESAVSP